VARRRGVDGVVPEDEHSPCRAHAAAAGLGGAVGEPAMEAAGVEDHRPALPQARRRRRQLLQTRRRRRRAGVPLRGRRRRRGEPGVEGGGLAGGGGGGEGGGGGGGPGGREAVGACEDLSAPGSVASSA
jgi:hypothetical protein